jgi:hypothetical protein
MNLNTLRQHRQHRLCNLERLFQSDEGGFSPAPSPLSLTRLTVLTGLTLLWDRLSPAKLASSASLDLIWRPHRTIKHQAAA